MIEISSALAALPGRRWTAPESTSIAGRLVQLLPSPKIAAPRLGEDEIGRRIVIAVTLVWIIFAGVWLGFVVENWSPAHPQMHAGAYPQMQAANAVQTR